jgi:hypothetical protein
VSSGELTQSVFDALETQPQQFPVGAFSFPQFCLPSPTPPNFHLRSGLGLTDTSEDFFNKGFVVINVFKIS